MSPETKLNRVEFSTESKKLIYLVSNDQMCSDVPEYVQLKSEHLIISVDEKKCANVQAKKAKKEHKMQMLRLKRA